MGDIINITCKNCDENEEFFIGVGMYGQLRNLYHCSKCNYLDIELDQGIENFLNTNKNHELNRTSYRSSGYCPCVHTRAPCTSSCRLADGEHTPIQDSGKEKEEEDLSTNE